MSYGDLQIGKYVSVTGNVQMDRDRPFIQEHVVDVLPGEVDMQMAAVFIQAGQKIPTLFVV